MNVLFVCNGNVARSQEAEAYFNETVANPDIHAQSAGINVNEGKPLDPLVAQVMSEDGISLDKAQRKYITEEMATSADLIVSFKPKDELPEYTQELNVRYWDVADPRHKDLEFHRITRDKVKLLVSQLVNEIAR